MRQFFYETELNYRKVRNKESRMFVYTFSLFEIVPRDGVQMCKARIAVDGRYKQVLIKYPKFSSRHLEGETRNDVADILEHLKKNNFISVDSNGNISEDFVIDTPQIAREFLKG